MATTPVPVGEENWVVYLEDARRNASDLEQHVVALEMFKTGAAAEPGSLKIWLAYCEYFRDLYLQALEPNPSWSQVEVTTGRDIFTLPAMLQQWQDGYEAVRFRLGDSHFLWDRWLELEMEQLARTRTVEGVKRISHLYRDRLLTPHLTWDETSQKFSSFLSEYNRAAWEETMKEVTAQAQEAKRLVAARENFEFPLQAAIRSGNVETQQATMKEYLAWEVLQSKGKNDKSDMADDLCCGLFSRALTGVFSTDGSVWIDYVVYLSSSQSPSRSLQDLLGVLQMAVEHCPSAGTLWSRYILAAEEAKLPFTEVEQIKHAATNNAQLYKDGMASLLDMYVAWCGFLKRSALQPNAPDEAVDVADVGLPTALEDVEVLGKRLYGKDYKGDPDFRLERVYIQYLTSKEESVDEARDLWNTLARKPLYADRYDFWRAYYLWEMNLFSQALTRASRSPTPSSSSGTATPRRATAVLSRAINRKTLDWPERAIGIYLQHCNDYEPPTVLRHAMDDVHKVTDLVAKRREKEAADAAAAAYAYQEQVAQAQAQAQEAAKTNEGDDAMATAEPPSASKRKRDHSPNGGDDDSTSKRPKKTANGPEEVESHEAMKRDREHTSVLVTGLPFDVTQTAIKKYFKEYGHINELKVQRDEDSETTAALIEFSSPQEAQDTVTFRDGKPFAESTISVKSGARLTLFVTNYPPEADETYIRDLFKDCGRVLAVRFPSLKFNTRRRFCYVTFYDAEDSAKATELDRKLLKGQFRLEVKYSDPPRRKQREGAVSEGRELHVTNLEGGTRDKDVRDAFAKYGSVTSVRMTGSRKPREGSASAFVDFETRGEAEKAMEELNGAKFGTRIIRVEFSGQNRKQVSKMTNPAAAGENGSPAASTPDMYGDEEMKDHDISQETNSTPSARKMVIFNLPDTVNDARVMTLVQPIGTVVKLTVRPSEGTAAVEFADEAAAGRATLQLDGHNLEGTKLRTGTMADLFREQKKGASKDTRGAKKGGAAAAVAAGGSGSASGTKSNMLAPPMVRRPVLGKRGGRRGLGMGFVPRRGG